jgi:WD40 repeat protein
MPKAKVHLGNVGLAVSASGRLAALQSRGVNQTREAILLWDLKEGKQVAKLPGVGFVPWAVTFSPDDKQLALQDPSNKRMTILVWDLTTRSLVSRLSSRGVQSSDASWEAIERGWGPPAPSFSPDGSLLASRGFRGGRPVLCLWDVETGAEMKALPAISSFWWRDQGRGLITLGARRGAEDRDWIIQFDPRGPRLPSGYVNLWEVSHLTSTYLLEGNIQSASFNADCSRLAVNDTVWEVVRHNEGYSLRRSAISSKGWFPDFAGPEGVKLLRFSPDRKRAATVSNEGLKVWNVARGEVERTLTPNNIGILGTQLTFSQDGGRLLVVREAGEMASTRCWISVFSIETGEELRSWKTIRKERDWWRSSALSPDGGWAASGGEDGVIHLWDVASGRELARWEGHEAGVSALTFHPDGTILVSGSKDGTLKLWNLPYIRKELAELGLDWPNHYEPAESLDEGPELRPLPWNRSADAFRGFAELALLIALGTALLLILDGHGPLWIVVPPVTVGCWFYLHSIDLDNAFWRTGFLIAFLGWLILSAVYGARRRVLTILGVWLFVALVMGGSLLWSDIKKMQPGERYSLAGWHWPLLQAAVLVGTVGAFWLPGWLIQSRRRSRR